MKQINLSGQFTFVVFHLNELPNQPRYTVIYRAFAIRDAFEREKPVFDRRIFDKLSDIRASFSLSGLFQHPSAAMYSDFLCSYL